MCRLILVRHGETEWNRQMLFQGATDTDLSAKGLRQAELVGRRLAAEPFTAVYNSDLKRAVLTATAIAVSRGLTVVTDWRLREISFGEIEGRNYAEIDQLWPGLTETLFHNPAELHIPGGEPFAEFARRLAAVISEIVDRHRQETVICVSHGCATRMILCLALGMDWRYFWNIRQDNTAVNIIEYQTRRSLVTLVNDTGHLTGADRAERYI